MLLDILHIVLAFVICDGWMGLDIGHETINLFEEALEAMKSHLEWTYGCF